MTKNWYGYKIGIKNVKVKMDNYYGYIKWMETKVKVPPPTPSVKVRRLKDYSGEYDSDTNEIIISNYVTNGKEERIATLVHEWRHAWQWHNKKWINGLLNPIPFDFTLPYKKAIQKYFGEQPWELDALQWSCRMLGTKYDLQHLQWVQSIIVKGKQNGKRTTNKST